MLEQDWVNDIRQNLTLDKMSMADAQQEFLEYVKGRQEGTIKSLVSRWPRLNSYLLDGFEENTICTVMAMSGVGKTAVAGMLMRDMYDETLNPTLNADTVSFNFEMLCKHLVGRQVSKQVNMSSRKMYSAGHQLTDEEFDRIQRVCGDLANPNVYFVEVTGSPKQICATILRHWEAHCKQENKLLVYIVDHVLLCQGREGEEANKKIGTLMDNLLALKKYISKHGGRSFGLILSQMNRDIQKTERRRNPDGHVPVTSDMFGASSIEHASDYILCYHKPAKLGISSYTPASWPSTISVHINGVWRKDTDIIYCHILKNRSGPPDITIPCRDLLHKFSIKEWNKDLFDTFVEEFEENKSVIYNINRP